MTNNTKDKKFQASKKVAGSLHGELIQVYPFVKTLLRTGVDVVALSIFVHFSSLFLQSRSCAWMPFWRLPQSCGSGNISFYYVGLFFTLTLVGGYVSTIACKGSRLKQSTLLTVGMLLVINIDLLSQRSGLTSMFIFSTLTFFSLFFGYRLFFILHKKKPART